jgi:hypothetical protein
MFFLQGTKIVVCCDASRRRRMSFSKREGRTYAVLFNADRAVVAVYCLAGTKLRLMVRATADETAKVAEIARQANK